MKKKNKKTNRNREKHLKCNSKKNQKLKRKIVKKSSVNNSAEQLVITISPSGKIISKTVTMPHDKSVTEGKKGLAYRKKDNDISTTGPGPGKNQ